MTKPAKRPRRPRDIATVNVDTFSEDYPGAIVHLRLYPGHSPKDAERLARWLVRWAEWRRQKDKKK